MFGRSSACSAAWPPWTRAIRASGSKARLPGANPGQRVEVEAARVERFEAVEGVVGAAVPEVAPVEDGVVRGRRVARLDLAGVERGSRARDGEDRAALLGARVEPALAADGEAVVAQALLRGDHERALVGA